MIGEEGLSFSSKTRKVAGEISVTDRITGKKEHFATAQCVHCGGHWQVQPGSGRLRGYCFMCKGLTCGDPGCDECVPAEARLEIMEGNGQTVKRYWNTRYVQDYLGNRKQQQELEKYFIKNGILLK